MSVLESMSYHREIREFREKKPYHREIREFRERGFSSLISLNSL